MDVRYSVYQLLIVIGHYFLNFKINFVVWVVKIESKKTPKTKKSDNFDAIGKHLIFL